MNWRRVSASFKTTQSQLQQMPRHVIRFQSGIHAAESGRPPNRSVTNSAKAHRRASKIPAFRLRNQAMKRPNQIDVFALSTYRGPRRNRIWAAAGFYLYVSLLTSDDLIQPIIPFWVLTMYQSFPPLLWAIGIRASPWTNSAIFSVSSSCRG